jgi:hypothetical protein
MGPSVPAALLNRLLAPDRGGLDPSIAAHLAGSLRMALVHVFGLIALISIASLAAALLFPRMHLARREPRSLVANE